jgi:hypothetical protein
MSDLVKRLRSRNGRPDGFGIGPVCDEAADRIEALEAALRQARVALLYHTDQTRPVFETQHAVAAINDLLKD